MSAVYGASWQKEREETSMNTNAERIRIQTLGTWQHVKLADWTRFMNACIVACLALTENNDKVWQKHRNTERPLQRFNCTLCCGNPEREIEGPCADQLSPNKCQLMDNGLGLDFEILPENPQKLSLPFISLLFHLVWRRLVQMPASNAD